MWALGLHLGGGAVLALGLRLGLPYHMMQAEAMGISDQRDSHDSMTGA